MSIIRPRIPRKLLDLPLELYDLVLEFFDPVNIPEDALAVKQLWENDDVFRIDCVAKHAFDMWFGDDLPHLRWIESRMSSMLNLFSTTTWPQIYYSGRATSDEFYELTFQKCITNGASKCMDRLINSMEFPIPTFDFMFGLACSSGTKSIPGMLLNVMRHRRSNQQTNAWAIGCQTCAKAIAASQRWDVVYSAKYALHLLDPHAVKLLVDKIATCTDATPHLKQERLAVLAHILGQGDRTLWRIYHTCIETALDAGNIEECKVMISCGASVGRELWTKIVQNPELLQLVYFMDEQFHRHHDKTHLHPLFLMASSGYHQEAVMEMLEHEWKAEYYTIHENNDSIVQDMILLVAWGIASSGQKWYYSKFLIRYRDIILEYLSHSIEENVVDLCAYIKALREGV